jgi:formylglycine-generating enzyme required for sulfatase activity
MQDGHCFNAAGQVQDLEVFVSATTKGYYEHRRAVTDLLSRRHAMVHVQKDHPTNLEDGPAIRRMIDRSQLIVCIIGRHFGYGILDAKPHDFPPELLAGHDASSLSWTQWEYLCAKQSVAASNQSERRRVLTFFDANPEWSRDEELQRAFYEKEQKRSDAYGQKMYYRFTSIDNLVKQLGDAISARDGFLDIFQAAQWAELRRQRRALSHKTWQRDFPDEYSCEGTELRYLGTEKPPYIATQKFACLDLPTTGGQKRFLEVAAFLSDRASETVRQARRGAVWRSTSRDAIVAAMLGGQKERENFRPISAAGDGTFPLRIYLVSGGGVGKSVTMQRLERDISDAGADRGAWACLIQATDLPEKPEDVFRTIAKCFERFLVKIRSEEAPSEQGSGHQPGTVRIACDEHGDDIGTIARWVKNDIAAGRLALLIDGLDHVGQSQPKLLIDLQANHAWDKTPVIVAGRPHPLIDWQDASSDLSRTMEANRWRFIEPIEFDESQSKAFLGGFMTNGAAEWRIDLVKDELRGLINVPRVLWYVRRLDLPELKNIRTAADIYWKALPKLIEETAARSPLKGGETIPVENALCLLSALAFMTFYDGSDRLRGYDAKGENESKHVAVAIDREFRDQLYRRVAAALEKKYLRDDFVRDMQALGHFSTLVGNGIIESDGIASDSLKRVVWANRTVQQFLTAHWLAAYAGADDADHLRISVFYPESRNSDATEDFNRFLAEMPQHGLDPRSWVLAARTWYDPDLIKDRPSARRWSAEMLYRSWLTMHDIAGRKVDDWWDTPYDNVATTPAGDARAALSPHAKFRTPIAVHGGSPATPLAAAALDAFFNDFERIRAAGDETQRALADEFATAGWVNVPDGELKMGSPKAKQGFPRKTLAYWNARLDEIAGLRVDGTKVKRISALKQAKICNKDEWFVGLQGEALKEEDVQNLYENIFRPFETVALNDSQRLPAARTRALKAIRDKWRRQDETPQEAKQVIAAFDMKEVPVLHEWFWLFAPGHRASVTGYLEARKTAHPPANHPVIYVSWYDAWAFCQWARWKENGVQYGCRLPHEPEWEFACRQSTDASGQRVETPFGQEYWWGTKFYAHEDSAKKENISTCLAHAKGAPGHTRSPHEAKPNGFGFKDMLGNVWEWSANLYDARKERNLRSESSYSRYQPTFRPAVNVSRAMRGGLWYFVDHIATCANRYRLECNDRDYKMGFRVVREVIGRSAK